MSVQTTYDRYAPTAYVGLIADNNPSERISKITEGTVGFGLAVQRGTNPDQAKIGGGSGGSGYLGISVRVLNQEGALADAALQYNDEDMMAIMRSGWIYLKIENTGSVGIALNMNDTTGVIKAGSPVAGETAIPGATLEDEVTVAGTIALCRFASEPAASGP